MLLVAVVPSCHAIISDRTRLDDIVVVCCLLLLMLVLSVMVVPSWSYHRRTINSGLLLL